jgi:hypothetical protein
LFPQRGRLVAVDCFARTFCGAVDVQGNAVTFDGTAWSKPRHLIPAGHFEDVACPTASTCFAVGGTATDGYAVRFTAGHAAVPRRVGNAALASIDCVSMEFCLAGDWAGRVARFDGSSWHRPNAVTPGSYVIGSISCASVTFCAAATGAGVRFFDGHSWTGGGPGPAASDISCSSPAFCAAPDVFGEMYLYRDGVWGDPVYIGCCGAAEVACTSASFCATAARGSTAATFNGSTWTREPAHPADAISCPSRHFCIGVDGEGRYTQGTSG